MDGTNDDLPSPSDTAEASLSIRTQDEGTSELSPAHKRRRWDATASRIF